MEITDKQRVLLQEALDYCDDRDKSIEFMLEYMQDVVGVDLDTVLKFLKENNIIWT